MDEGPQLYVFDARPDKPTVMVPGSELAQLYQAQAAESAAIEKIERLIEAQGKSVWD